jgi:hypothetical protein
MQQQIIRCLINNESEILWKKKVMTRFQVLPWHFPEVAEENSKEPQGGELVSRPKFDLSFSQV